MATGATDDYWERQALPSVYKHALLRHYIPVFGGKTGSTRGGVVFLDGYAGRGRHADGTPGSAELILQTAEHQSRTRIAWTCFLFEKDRTSYESLTTVAEAYAARGVHVTVRNSDVEQHLEAVISAANGLPLFLFLDPCGLGIPYNVLVETLRDPRRLRQPTEALLNFSMEAVRRIGGHVISDKGSESTLLRLDQSLGGPWWRSYFTAKGRDPDGVVTEFVHRLAQDTGFGVGAVPVRRASHHQPVYYLVFVTRSNHGVWYFSDAAARAGDEWRKRLPENLSAQGRLFETPEDMTLDQLDAAAVPDIAENISNLLAKHKKFTVLNYPTEILGDHLGEVRINAVRAAIKQLHAGGKTSSDGKGRHIERLVVKRPE